MTSFQRQANTYHVIPDPVLDFEKMLPVGNYIVQYNPDYNFYYLEIAPAFEPLKKYYGTTERDAQRILNTFNDVPNQLGAMLAGVKGSGKTLLAKKVSIEGYKLGLPTIMVNQPFGGDGFNKFIQNIDQPAIILFDEFEKTYGSANKKPQKKKMQITLNEVGVPEVDTSDDQATAQQNMLTLLDGVFTNKKLFIFTTNDMHAFDSHMKNRPGRIYYVYQFEGMKEEFIREYCADKLKAQDNTETVVRAATMFDHFSFDMLQAIVGEMNRYNETAAEVVAILNTRPEFETGSVQKNYTPSVVVSDKSIEYDYVYPNFINNPHKKSHIEICLMTRKKFSKEEHKSAERKGVNPNVVKTIRFDTKNFDKENSPKGGYTFYDQEGNSLILEAHTASAWSYDHYLE